MILALAMVLTLLPTDLAVAAETGLYYRHAAWDEATETHYEDTNFDLENAIECSIDSGFPCYFYYVDEVGNETRLSASDLTVSDPEAVRVTDSSEWINAIDFHISAFGTYQISYAAPNGSSYGVTVTGTLPFAAFYSAPVANVENYITSFTVTETANTFYFVLSDSQCKLTDVRLWDGLVNIATAEIKGDGAYAEIVVTGTPDNSAPYGVSYDFVRPDGSSDWGNQHLSVYDGTPGLAYREPDYNNGPIENRENYLEHSLNYLEARNNRVLFFYFKNADGEVLVTGDQLVSSNTDVLTVSTYYYNTDAVMIKGERPGDAEIQYIAEDGKVYSMPITITLPDVGFYKEPVISEENYINQFTVTDEEDKFYLVFAEGYRLISMELERPLADIAEYQIMDDGAYAEIKVTGIATSGDRCYVDYQYEKEDRGPYQSSISIQLYNKKTHLAYNGCYWEDDVPYPSKQQLYTRMGGEPGDVYERCYYFISNGEKTLVPPAQLRSSNESVATIDPHPLNADVAVVRFHGFGHADIIYTAEDGIEYIVTVDVELPYVGFYSEPTAAEEYFIQQLTVTDENNTFYVIMQSDSDYRLTTVSLEGDLADIAEYQIMNDGTYAMITITGTPDSNRYYNVYYEWQKEEYGYTFTYTGDRSIQLISGKPHLAFRWCTWEDDVMYPAEGDMGIAMEEVPGTSHTRFFYFVVNGVETLVTADQLRSSDESVLTIERNWENGDATEIYIHSFGQADIIYTAEDGTEYGVSVLSCLPRVGFYSAPEATEENYINELTVTEENNIFYVVPEAGYKLTYVELREGLQDIAEYQIMENGAYAVITVTGEPEDRHYDVYWEFESEEDGWSDGNSWGIHLKNGKAHLAYAHELYDDRNTDPYLAAGYDQSWYVFLIEAGEEHILDPGQLYSSDPDVIVVEPDEWDTDKVRIIPVGFGDAELCYNDGDKIYTMAITVGLPNVGFYSQPVASEENYLFREFTVTEENNVFYMVMRKDDRKMINLRPNDEFADIAEFALSEDGKYVKITVTGDCNDNQYYGISFDVEYQDGRIDTDWGESLRLFNGKPGLVAQTRWDQTLMRKLYMMPGDGDVFYFYYVENGQKTPVTAEQLTTSDPSVAVISDRDDMVAVECVGFGEAEIRYTAENGTVYSVKVISELPGVGFYSAPAATEENWINEFYVSDTNNKVYVAALDGFTIEQVFLNDYMDIATVQYDDSRTFATITFHDVPAKSGWWYYLEVFYSSGNDDLWQEQLGMCLYNDNLALRACWPGWDDDSVHGVFYDSMNAAPGAYNEMWFYLANSKSETRLSLSDLRSSDPSVVRLEEAVGDPSMVRIKVLDFGEADIIYEEDGVEYRFHVVSELSSFGFSTDTVLSEETFISKFTVTEDAKTFYYAFAPRGLFESQEFWFKEIEPSEELAAIADITISEDKTYVIITITGVPRHDQTYHISWVGNASEDPQSDWTGGDMISLINGLPVSDKVSTEIEENEDGSTTITNTAEDGSTATTIVDMTGESKTEVTLSEEAIQNAEDGASVELPMTPVGANSESAVAPEVTVTLPDSVEEGETVKVEIPVVNANAGTVAVIVHADGTEEIIRTTVQGESGIKVDLEDGDTIKVLDNSKDFEDVSGDDWFNEAVMFASSREMVNGTGDGSNFSPELLTTRGMIMTILARFNGADTTPEQGEEWYQPGMEWSVVAGISDGTNPMNNLTREQLAVMLWRMVGEPIVENDMSQFSDVDKISSWALDAMRWATSTEVGLIKGGGDGRMDPGGEAIRSVVAQMLKNFIEAQWG